MTTPGTVGLWLAGGLSTGGLQGWIQDNVVPLVLLGIAIILMWIGGRGDTASNARRGIGLIVGVTEIDTSMASLSTG